MLGGIAPTIGKAVLLTFKVKIMDTCYEICDWSSENVALGEYWILSFECGDRWILSSDSVNEIYAHIVSYGDERYTADIEDRFLIVSKALRWVLSAINSEASNHAIIKILNVLRNNSSDDFWAK